MSFRVQAMASGLRDATRPRRFDLTMSRRTRRPAASLAANFHEEDTDAPQCLCLSDHLKSRHSEDTEAHKASAESEATEESDTQQQQQQQECQDDSRRFSPQELIQVETGGAVDGDRDAATGGHEGDPDANVAVAHGVSGAAAGAAAAGRSEEQVVGRKVIGMMRRYVRVRSIKTKHARAPEKNVVPIC